MKVVYVYADSPHEWNCSEWNCIIPTKSFNKTKNHSAKSIYINDFTANTKESAEACSSADIIIVERNYFGDALAMIQYWKVRNKTVIGIFDDAYDKLHPQNIAYEFWIKGNVKYKSADSGEEKIATVLPPPLEQFKWGVQSLKAIQVPSVMLASDWSEYNKTYYVHNYLDMDKYIDVQPLYPHDDLVIGWVGSLSHYDSFSGSGVLDALNRISRKYPNVTLLISGDKRVFDLLEAKKKVFQPFVPAEKWTSLIKTLDIGLAPLNGEYDKRRSWIKGLEYMALKIPWIASNYQTYDELKEYGIMTENGYKGWTESLIEMIENYPMYKAKAEGESYDFAVEHSSYTNIEKVHVKLYEELINSPYPIFDGNHIKNR